jgi:hypothetical protein
VFFSMDAAVGGVTNRSSIWPLLRWKNWRLEMEEPQLHGYSQGTLSRNEDSIALSARTASLG